MTDIFAMIFWMLLAFACGWVFAQPFDRPMEPDELRQRMRRLESQLGWLCDVAESTSHQKRPQIGGNGAGGNEKTHV